MALEKLQLNLPDMWADHHVLRVRATLAGLAPSVQNVIASSAFRMLALDYDATATTPAAIEAALSAAGYPPADEPGTVNPVSVEQDRHGDPSWGHMGFRTAQTDARDTKTAR